VLEGKSVEKKQLAWKLKLKTNHQKKDHKRTAKNTKTTRSGKYFKKTSTNGKGREVTKREEG